MNPLDNTNNFFNPSQNVPPFKNILPIETNTLTIHEKEQLYKMYLDTYSEIDGNYFRHDDFIAKFPEHYDIAYYQKNQNGEIVNVYLCNSEGNKNGIKICLIFGKKDKLSSEARIESLKEMLLYPESSMYLEASGPIAAILLKDDKIPVSLVTETSDKKHYSSLKTRHGKKLMFGHPKMASITNNNMREFYFNLYEYNKIKLKLSKMPLEDSVKCLNNLFKQVENSKIPIVYKAILLSKINRKISAIQPDNKASLHQQSQILDLLNMASLNDFNQIHIVAQKEISESEQVFLQEMLSEKIEKLKNKHLK